ncbi:MAG: methyltransferase domain-containing protein [Methylophaga sp.]|nr:methyltransferase domain-containing protein [Methylophaga sp.]
MAVEHSVLDRYSKGADEVQPDLCCPVDYDASLLKLLPQEIIDKDYGCGDPSRYVKEGDVVLDLGAGSGKICYMAAQLVGDNGKVIGIDMNDDMLALARKYQAEMAEKLGGDKVRFVKGLIQDLAVNLDAVDTQLKQTPISDAESLIRHQQWQQKQSNENPLIANDSIDLVVSNCVLNLVQDSDKTKMIEEIFRVTKPGGRVAISDIVSDEYVPQHLKDDPTLWSGCISGALQEQEMLDAFVKVGFVAVAYDKWENEPWQVVEDIEFRSVTITATKPKAAPCLDVGHAVIYRGPYSEVYDDEGHVYPRGQRIATCARSFELMTQGIYGDDFIGITPKILLEAKTWCSPAGTLRPAAETKGATHTGANEGCSDDGDCC